MAFSPRYIDQVQELDALCNYAIPLSERTQDQLTNWSGQTASLAFAKLALASISFLRLTPGSSFCGPANGQTPWDISSAASIGRDIIEGYHILVYLLGKPQSPEEMDFRTLLWDYHEIFERYQMVSVALPDSKRIPEVQERLDETGQRLRLSPVFQKLSQKFQAELLKGKHFKLPSPIELSRQAGISENYYRSQYKYCSAYAHTAPFSIAQLLQFRAGTIEAEQLFGTMVERVSAYFSMAIRDFSMEFDPATPLPESIKHSIEIWGQVLKWEKQTWFKAQDAAASAENT